MTPCVNSRTFWILLSAYISRHCCTSGHQVCESRREAVKKYTPETECKKVPRQLCGPSGCVPEAGPEECFDKKSTIVVEVRPSPPGITSRPAPVVHFIGNKALFFQPVEFIPETFLCT